MSLRLFADEKERFTEKQCTPYLEAATDILIPRTPHTIYDLKLEERSYYGRSDYIVVADLKEGTGPVQRHVYFWELKAPQSNLVEIDDSASRYRPTKALMKAETQLIHYTSEARGSEDFRKRYKILYPENIKMGGIIIGRDSGICVPAAKANDEAAAHSFHLRKMALYDHAKIEIITWDRILDFVAPR